MELNQLTIKKVIELGQDSKPLEPAIAFQKHLQGHGNISRDGQQFARDKVRCLAKSKLVDEKVDKLMDSLQSPLPSTEIVGEVYEKLQAVMNPRNSSQTWEGEQNAINAAKEWLGETKAIEKFRVKQFQLFKEAPNSIIVVDSKTPKGKDSPEAYIAYRDVSKLYRWELQEDGVKFNWAIFKESEDEFSIYTDAVFAKYIQIGDTKNFAYTEVVHNIGRCPVLFLMQEKGDANNHVFKKTQLFNQLPGLDNINFQSASFLHQKATSIWSILVIPARGCKYESRSEGENNQIIITRCEGGYLTRDGLSTLVKCPRCNGKDLAGAGTVIGKPLPSPNQPEMKDPVSFVAPPIEDVKFTKEDLADMAINAVVSCTGKQPNAIANKIAFNKDQVLVGKEGYETILRNIDKQFAFAESWAITTLIHLQFQGSTVKYTRKPGTEFFTLTEEELCILISDARTTNKPAWYIENLEEQLAELVFKNNPTARQRKDVLEAIEPYRGISLEDAGRISQSAVVEKLLFTEFVRDYELTKENIGMFEQDNFKVHILRLRKMYKEFIQENYGKAEGSQNRNSSSEVE